MRPNKWLVVFLTLCNFASASPGEPSAAKTKERPSTLIAPYPPEVALLEVVSFKPIDKHHFSLQAPQKCDDGAAVKKSARQIQCQFEKPGVKSVLLSVCDDNKTFCKQEKKQVVVTAGKGSSSQTLLRAKPVAAVPEPSDKASKAIIEAAGFKEVSVSEAKEILQRSQKKGLVLISTAWCPSCNVLKEVTLSNPDFNKATSDLEKFYVDGDLIPLSRWDDKLKIYFYPSLVIVDSNLNEIDRQGPLYLSELLKWISETKSQTPMSDLSQRVSERANGSWVRWIRDLLEPKGIADLEAVRYARWLMNTGQPEKAQTAVQGLTSDIAKLALAEADFNRLAGGDPNDLSPEDKQIMFDRFTLAMRQDKSLVEPSSLAEICEADQKRCEELATEVPERMNARFKQKALTGSEAIIEQVGMMSALTGLYDGLKLEQKMKEAAKECVRLSDELLKSNPSFRGVRQIKFNCLSRAGRSDEALVLAKDLVKEFPYEPTFYLSIARHLKKQKRFKEAYAYVETGEQYGFGRNWVSLATLKAELEIELGNLRQAQASVATIREQVGTTKDPTSWEQRVLARLRALEQRL